MPDISSLASRIDAEFSAVEQKIKKIQVEQVQAHQQRQQRLERLGKLFEQLGEIWRPRLELLMKKFGDRVKVTPHIIPTTREATFDFESRQARVRLKFSATTDRDIQNLILSYDLEIIPVLMRYKQHDQVEFDIYAVDKDAIANWIDERIVDFVQTYLSLGENEYYMKDQMVEDPIAHVRFPKMAAATTFEWQGQTYYFIGEETRREFENQQGIGSK